MATIDPYVLKLFFSNDSFRCSFLLPGPGLPLVVVRACIRVGSPEKALHFVREKVKKNNWSQSHLDSTTQLLVCGKVQSFCLKDLASVGNTSSWVL